MQISRALLGEDPLHHGDFELWKVSFHHRGLLPPQAPESAASLPAVSRCPQASRPCLLLAAIPARGGKPLPGPEPAHPSESQQPWLRHCHAAQAKPAFTEQRFSQVSPPGNFSPFFMLSLQELQKFPPTNLPVTCVSISPRDCSDGFPHPGYFLIPGMRWEPGQLQLTRKAQLRFTSQILRGSLLKIRTWLFTNKPKEGPAAF